MSTPSLTSPQPLHHHVSQQAALVVGLIVAVALAITLLAANNNTGRATSHVLREPLTPAALAYRAETAHQQATSPATSPATTAARSSDDGHFSNPVTSANPSAEAGAKLDHRGLGFAAADPVAAGFTELSSGMGHR